MKKEKYQQIFNYLLEFSKIRSKPVRDIELQDTHYPERFWLADIPENEHFEKIISKDFDQENDYWIKIKKPKEPEKPSFTPLSKTLQPWVDSLSLINDEAEPILKDEIELNGRTLSIIDFPEIGKEFHAYINQKWIDDLITFKTKFSVYEKEYEIFEIVNNVYKSFFRIFNKSQQFGEEYELIVAVGLLNFKENSEKPKIFRHIITQRVEISFEYSERDSQIIVGPTLESSPQIETDSIIDLFDQFDSQNIIDAEKAVDTFIRDKGISHLFYDSLIKDALQIFADRFSPDGKFIDQILKPNLAENKPSIFFSPALLLRKRDTRSFTALYERILQNIEEEGEDIDIPTIDDLIAISDNFSNGYPNEDIQNLGSKFDPIYFPKEYNDEQIEIIEKARRNNKVLVQGPPGTGKSHTIANIVCHLLATGKKVLITAYTKRALEVLKEKLPPEFQSLAVNLLSGDTSSMQDLQASVNAINEEFSRGNPGEYAKQIEQLSKNLSDVRERIALTTNELIQIKEKSIRNQEINPSYKGTLTEIAEKLERDTLEFIWYNDNFFDLENHSIENDLKTFVELLNYYKKINVIEFNSWLPNLENLPTVEDLIQYKSAVELLKGYALDQAISTINCNDFIWLNTKLKELDDIYRKIDTSQESYSQSIISSYLKGNSYLWRQKIEMSAKILDRIQEVDFQHWKHNVRISYNANRDIIDLKNDAKALLDYLNQGHFLSGVSFKLKKSFLPKEIKEKLYFIEKVQVNGSPCDSQKELEEVIKDIELKQDFQELADTWERDTIPKSSSFDKKFSFFKNIHSETIKVINIIEKALQISSEIENRANIKISPFDANQLNQLLRATEYNHLQKTIEYFRLLVGNAITYLNHNDKHPVTNDIINQFQQIDGLSYEQSIKDIQSIFNKKAKYIEFKDLEAKLKETIPILISEVKEEKLSFSQLSKFNTAIRFRHAQSEIKKLMNIEYEQGLFNDLKNYEKKEKLLIARIASILAWKYVIEGLQNNRSLRQYLEAWVQAVKKIGKTGKGKRALKFRKEAQLQMDKCKSSVPCWIMPLYKVAETIQPEQGMYDYVIIDEASQLGPDAIFLLYISKNIIIVGDDKQTSPEYVGVDANTMTPHINRHLKDIPFANYYGTEFSFFDHARRFCDGITVLREHFRCMPEIIEFCNKHFYARDHIGLYPLKQYSEKRLEPLQSIFCAEGYTEGNGSRIINEPEAKRIAQKISELVKDVKYKDKTMGVIVLQGSQQGAIIENLLLKAIGESEFHKRKIVCGNSASFQGDERDIIFLSLVTASNHNRASLTKPEDERRFNVAVSRAKEQIWLFHSVEMDDLSNKEDLRFKLLDHFKNGNTKSLILNKPVERKIGTQPEPFESWFEVDVYNDIVCSGYSVIPQYEVAKGKYRIDLVAIFHDGTKIAIECDGDIWHSSEQYQNDILRQKDLERCGWRFFRVRGYEYYTNRKKALEPLWQMIPKKEHIEEKESNFSKNDDAFEAPEGENPNNQKEDIVNSSVNFEGSDESNEVTEDFEESSLKQDTYKILRYFNLYKSGIYILTEEKPLNADFIIPIKSNQRNGFLLQCYDSGHINKVFVSVLLSRRIGKEYMNGLNLNDHLIYLTIIDTEKIIGIYFNENGKRKFKAHLTENISCRELLHLQGYKVIYNDYSRLEYKILPLELNDDINRLVFQSFNANGKPVDNNYYDHEWNILNQFSKKDKIASNKVESNIITEQKEHKEQSESKEQKENKEPITQTLFDNLVNHHSTVRLRYLNKDKEFIVHLVDYETKEFEPTTGIQKIYNKSPLAVSIIGKTVGENVKIGNTAYYVEIMEIL